MKNVVFVEITDHEGDVVNNIEFDVPEELLKFNHVDDLVDNVNVFDFLDDIIYEIVYGYFNGSEDFDIINEVAVTFVNDNKNFICTFTLAEIEEEFNEDEDDVCLNYKIGITDWENSGYIFRYAEDTEDLCKE